MIGSSIHIRVNALFVLLSITTTTFAQTVKHQLMDVGGKYNTSNYLLQQTIKYYPNYTTDTVLQTQQQTTIKTTEGMFVESPDKIDVINKDYVITVDKNYKVILVKATTPEEFQSLNKFEFDKLYKEAYQVDSALSGNEFSCRMYYDIGELHSVELFIDIHTNEVNKMIYYYSMPQEYNEKEDYPRLEINVKNSFENNIESDKLKTSGYIIKQGNAFKAVTAYKDYELIDLSSEKIKQ